MRERQGVSLMELLVVLVLMGILWSLTALGARPNSQDRRDPCVLQQDTIRRHAIRTGRPMVAVMTCANAAAHSVRFLPDGDVIAQDLGREQQ